MVHYIANIFFELELENLAGNDLKNALAKNKTLKQLQYLPLLYLTEDDTLLVTEYPQQSYLDRFNFPLPNIELIGDVFMGQKLLSWGASDLISKWAKDKFAMPSFSCAKKINSKLWTFQHVMPLKGAKVIFSQKELEDAVSGTSLNWVLKTDQGFAGRGNLVFNLKTLNKALKLVDNHSQNGLILEPWVERALDFSSQWVISKEGEIFLLGITKCLNTPQGVYSGTEAGPPALVFGKFLPLVEEHVAYCKNYLKKVVKEGFYGHLGIDAMVYDRATLHPIVEVNARMTMSAAIFLYHQFHRESEVTRIYYSNHDSNKTNLLPDGYQRKLIVM